MANEEKGDNYKEDGVNNQFGYWMVDADVNVVSQPCGGEPASPVLATEHAHPANECEKPQ